jgi:tetratricopeptide (TPR) repeat protein
VVAPLLMMLEQDAKNADVLTQIGNLYYDHHAYRQAVPYYRRALETRPDDANIRTDLGTALWMSGDPRAALSEYEQVLRKNPNFAPALMNTGIVRLNGLNDAQGAIDAWEKLLATNPQFSERQRVLDLLAQARGSVPAGRAAPR